MTTYQKLLRAVKSKNLHEAHELFKDVMQVKVAARLAEERKTLMSEDTGVVHLGQDKLPFTPCCGAKGGTITSSPAKVTCTDCQPKK